MLQESETIPDSRESEGTRNVKYTKDGESFEIEVNYASLFDVSSALKAIKRPSQIEYKEEELQDIELLIEYKKMELEDWDRYVNEILNIVNNSCLSIVVIHSTDLTDNWLEDDLLISIRIALSSADSIQKKLENQIMGLKRILNPTKIIDFPSEDEEEFALEA
ncbi:MAG: hypothetical protein Q9M91_07300 [Candidatus Dojkabacteria bacterium]|nr:hypothetical protein [Candidatus Dojkabacteria bacterium]MDQ7021594.1 hypothetical protein [Candidatus Dojkabacteria bacterium]